MSILTALYNFFLMPLQLLFEVVYRYAYRLLENPGLAIIALSLAINLLVLPLYRRADAIQEEERDIEAKLAPGVEHIKKTFKGDERTMMLQTYYRQNNYSPLQVLRSAISLFLQIPFFIAAYRFLSTLPILQGVSFGPIADLGAPDGLILIGGMAINLLPILMTLINVISTVIFTKGYPTKTKVQLYALAAFFLVFLYNSPSGLVFYWTLNNLFSLIKTIFYKLKEPKKVLTYLAAGIGVISFGIGIWLFTQPDAMKKAIIVTGLGIILCVPLMVKFFKQKKAFPLPEMTAKPDKKLFFLGMVFLALLVGLLIPSALIGDSPQEFLTLNNEIHPVWYVVNALLISLGTFVFWGGVFYVLAAPKTKVVFERVVWIICGVAIIDYLFFGKEMGIISVNLSYEQGFFMSIREKLINIVVVLGVMGIMALVVRKWQTAVRKVLLVGVLAVGCMSCINVVGICQSVSQVNPSEVSDSIITLSQNGKNVIVFMLDRALGEDVPFIFNEKPELKEQFSGFTYYSNVISFGPTTNFAVPALFGGYEYTPVELNKRDQESLESKHNEALKVMPVLFSKEGYNVTVCDPPYAGYQWVPDLSIFDDYPEIKRFNTIGNVSDESVNNDNSQENNRNFFCYGLMKVVPSFLQGTLYDNGQYNTNNGDNDSSSAFTNAFLVLKNLSNITSVSKNDHNTFLMIQNDAPHYPMMLQEPDYVPTEIIDNSAYDEAHSDRFAMEGYPVKIENDYQLSHYHVNMATFIQLGKWFEELKRQGVYDNTRIILVSDHGSHVEQSTVLMKDDLDLEFFYPLLMVKDFNSKDFMTSDSFMTNGDVPTLATQGIIDNPTNPFSGQQINNAEKTAHDQYIIYSGVWDTNENNGNTFLPADWYRFHAKPLNWDKNNWTKIGENMVLKNIED